MSNYYADKLNSQSLFQVYETAIPRVQQYLDSEIDFVRHKLKKSDRVLEVGAGYGRIMKHLASYCETIAGIDISADNVESGKEYLKDCPNASMMEMDVHQISFNQDFDVVLCLQNGLSAIGATAEVIEKILNIAAPGGTIYFSTYSEKFWKWRIQWFEEQAKKDLLGEIDYSRTKDGVIACKDGFRASTQTREEYIKLGKNVPYSFEIQEVDDSSLFLIIQK